MAKKHSALYPVLVGIIIAAVTALVVAFKAEPTNQVQVSPIPKATRLPTAPPQSTQAVQYRAVFAMFTNDTFRTFTSPLYHAKSPDAYIEASHPNVVYIKKSPITWGEFFKTLPLQVDPSCLVFENTQHFCTDKTTTLRFYLNGHENPDLLAQPIQDGDRALVSFGENTAADLANEQTRLLTIPL